MLYIITEDSGSAREFWGITAEALLEAGTYTMVPLPGHSAGNTTLEGQVRNLRDKLGQGDALFVAFDNVSSSYFDVVAFIERIRDVCDMAGAKFMYTSYYCFEEIYLSYPELYRMYSLLPNANGIVAEVLLSVLEKIGGGEDYFNVYDEKIKKFIAYCDGDAGNNREHFANQLLIYATNLLKGFFKIHKSKGVFGGCGKCWLKSCGEIQNHLETAHVSSLCVDACCFCCKGSGAKYKIEDLRDHSIFGCSFPLC